jgi:hypothetical protein
VKHDDYIFGFDISSSCIGWAIFRNNQYSDSGFIKFKTAKTNLYERCSFFAHWFEAKLRYLNVYNLKVAIEAPKMAHSASTARTLSTLQRFNGMVSYAIYARSGTDLEMVDERHARKQCGIKLIKYKKNDPDKIKEKIQAGNHIMALDWFPKEHITYKKTGTIRDECYDETDAVIIALSQIPA